MDVYTIEGLFHDSYCFVMKPEYIYVYEKVMTETFKAYDLNWDQFKRKPVDQENCRLFLEISVKIFNSLIKNADSEIARCNIRHLGRLIIPMIIQRADRAEAEILPEFGEITFGETNDPLRISMRSTLQTTVVTI